MKRQTKIISLALLIAVMFGISLAGNFLVVPDFEPADVGPPVIRYQIAAVAALDATGANENNMTMTDASPIDNHGDDLLAGNYEEYVICVNASDADGLADIDNIFAALQTGAGVNVTTFNWENTGANTVTEGIGAANVILGTWVNVTGANDVDIEIPFSIEWDFGDTTDLDLNITVDEGGAQVAKIEVNLNLDVVATLTMSDSTMFTYADYLTGASYGGIECTYHYTGYTTLYALDAETDFWVQRTAEPTEQLGVEDKVSSAYAEGTGVAQFDTIIAPDINERTEFTYTMLAVDNGDGVAGTDLTAATYTDTVWVDPTVGHTGEPDEGWIIPPIFDSAEGVMLVGGIAVVVGAGTYYFHRKGSSTSTRRRGKRRKPAKKKTKRKRRRSK